MLAVPTLAVVGESGETDGEIAKIPRRAVDVLGLSEPGECDRYGLPRIVADGHGFKDRARKRK